MLQATAVENSLGMYTYHVVHQNISQICDRSFSLPETFGQPHGYHLETVDRSLFYIKHQQFVCRGSRGEGLIVCPSF